MVARQALGQKDVRSPRPDNAPDFLAPWTMAPRVRGAAEHVCDPLMQKVLVEQGQETIFVCSNGFSGAAIFDHLQDRTIEIVARFALCKIFAVTLHPVVEHALPMHPTSSDGGNQTKVRAAWVPRARNIIACRPIFHFIARPLDLDCG
jgi:hypothetical protein